MKYICLVLGFCLFITACETQKYQAKMKKDNNNYVYEAVTNDDSNTRIYTLENGLKVYLSVNKEEPRIFTQIGVRAGSTYDPKETTGLAHYLEHMLFKGTSSLGALDWQKEKPLLDEIRNLYEVHKSESDSEKKKKIYAQIDSISQLAAAYVSPNEYDKLISSIGATRTNAYTSTEETVYVNEIPSNEINRWLKIERERFGELVLRLFHTELEAVYEEFNMRMKDSDFRKSFSAMLELLYEKHPLGTQTVIGEPEHLKNPSWINIEDYFKKYYVPNNMCIAMSGDLDMDSTIKMIDSYFGDMTRKSLGDLTLPKEDPISKVRTKEILGPDAEFMVMGFRLGDNKSGDEKYANLVSKILYNGTAGLIDLNLVQKQKLLSASTFYWQHRDYGTQMFFGYAREGQDLDEVRALILSQLDSIKSGSFNESLMKAAVTDLRKAAMRESESNYNRCAKMMNAFIQDYEWSDVLAQLDEIAAIDKESLMKWTQSKFSDNNYVVVYKKSGTDNSFPAIEKPQITPVDLKRGVETEKYKEISAMESSDIRPVFLNFQNDINHSSLRQDVPLKLIKNTLNSRFSIVYSFDFGKDFSLGLSLALNYLPLSGTSKYSPSELKKKWYELGVDMNVTVRSEKCYVSVNGIKESMSEAIDLLEHTLREAKIDTAIYNKYIDDILKERDNNMKSKGYLFYGAMNYLKYGPESSFTNILTENEMRSKDVTGLEKHIHSLLDFPHEVLFYGKLDDNELTKDVLTKKLSKHLINDRKVIPDSKKYNAKDLMGDEVYFIDYEMEQVYLIALAQSAKFNKDLLPFIKIYNKFFGSGLSSIVFQEIRESRALAYSARSSFTTPTKVEDNFYLQFTALTQADKLNDMVNAFQSLIQNLPDAKEQFEGAKLNILKEIESERITKTNIYWTYKDAQKLGLNEDVRAFVYKEIKGMTFEKFKSMFNEYVKNAHFQYLVLGDESKVKESSLSKLGKVKRLSRTEVLNY